MVLRSIAWSAEAFIALQFSAVGVWVRLRLNWVGIELGWVEVDVG